MYLFPHNLSNNLTPNVLREKNISRKPIKCTDIKVSAHPARQNESFDSCTRNLHTIPLFYVISGNCSQYFLKDCLWKLVFVSNMVHTPWNLHLLQI